MERHVTTCPDCSAELNDQKNFLRSLDVLKDEKPLKLPADFTKKVVANAESSVAGLRGDRERFNAVFICAGLSLFVLFAISSDGGKWASTAVDSGGRGFTVAGLVLQAILSFVLGVSMVIRSFVTQFGSVALLVALVSVFAAFVLVFLSRRLLRFDRA